MKGTDNLSTHNGTSEEFHNNTGTHIQTETHTHKHPNGTETPGNKTHNHQTTRIQPSSTGISLKHPHLKFQGTRKDQPHPATHTGECHLEHITTQQVPQQDPDPSGLPPDNNHQIKDLHTLPCPPDTQKKQIHQTDINPNSPDKTPGQLQLFPLHQTSQSPGMDIQTQPPHGHYYLKA